MLLLILSDSNYPFRERFDYLCTFGGLVGVSILEAFKDLQTGGLSLNSRFSEVGGVGTVL